MLRCRARPATASGVYGMDGEHASECLRRRCLVEQEQGVECGAVDAARRRLTVASSPSTEVTRAAARHGRQWRGVAHTPALGQRARLPLALMTEGSEGEGVEQAMDAGIHPID